MLPVKFLYNFSCEEFDSILYDSSASSCGRDITRKTTCRLCDVTPYPRASGGDAEGAGLTSSMVSARERDHICSELHWNTHLLPDKPASPEEIKIQTL